MIFSSCGCFGNLMETFAIFYRRHLLKLAVQIETVPKTDGEGHTLAENMHAWICERRPLFSQLC